MTDRFSRLGTPGMAGMSTPVGLTPNFASMTPEQIQATWRQCVAAMGHNWETVLWIVWPTIQQYYPLLSNYPTIQKYIFLQLSNMTFPLKVFLLEVLRSSLNQEVGSQADHQRFGINLNDNSQSSGSLECSLWCQAYRYDAEINERNAPMTDEEIAASAECQQGLPRSDLDGPNWFKMVAPHQQLTGAQ